MSSNGKDSLTKYTNEISFTSRYFLDDGDKLKVLEEAVKEVSENLCFLEDVLKEVQEKLNSLESKIEQGFKNSNIFLKNGSEKISV